LLFALCSLLFALCSLLFALCSLLFAFCYLLSDIYSLLSASLYCIPLGQPVHLREYIIFLIQVECPLLLFTLCSLNSGLCSQPLRPGFPASWYILCLSFAQLESTRFYRLALHFLGIFA
jgi:hypothetical protein